MAVHRRSLNVEVILFLILSALLWLGSWYWNSDVLAALALASTCLLYTFVCIWIEIVPEERVTPTIRFLQKLLAGLGNKEPPCRRSKNGAS